MDEGFFDWLESEDGAQSWQAIDDIQDALSDATVDPHKRKIIWSDGKQLTIDQTAERINQSSNVDLNKIKHHIALWLQMDYVPLGLSQKEMSGFESLVAD